MNVNTEGLKQGIKKERDQIGLCQKTSKKSLEEDSLDRWNQDEPE